MVELLKVFNAVEHHFLMSLKVQIQLSLHPCDPLFLNMTGNSVEKCFAALNVKLQVKLRFKSCYLLLSP